MTNDILNTEITSKSKVSSKNKLQVDANPKNEVSLFDKILQQNAKGISSKSDVNVDENNPEVNNKITQNVKNKSENKTSNERPSLLDNMLKNINLSKKTETVTNKTSIDTKINNDAIKSKVGEETLNKGTIEVKDTKITNNVINKVVKENLNSKIDTTIIDETIKKNSNLKVNNQLQDGKIKTIAVNDSEIKKDNSSLLNNNKTSDTFELLNKKSTNLDIKNIVNNTSTALKNDSVKLLETVSKLDINKVNKNDLKMVTQTDSKVVESKSDVKDEKVVLSKNIIDSLSDAIKNINTEKTTSSNELSSNKKEIVSNNIIANNELLGTKTTKKDNIISLNNETTINKVVSVNINDSEKSTSSTLMSQLINNAKSKENISDNLTKGNLNKAETLQGNIKASNFLNEQNINKKIISKTKINESKELLQNTEITSAKEKIVKSSNILELNSSKVEITNEKEVSKPVVSINAKLNEQNNFLNKIFLKQNTNIDKAITDTNIKNVEENNAKELQINKEKLMDTEKTVNLEATTLQNITTKIISARQNITSFMSNLSRKMYENYKPPVTTFKINLNPSALGSISIIIKSNKSENSMSVSMNVSQSSTMDVLEEHKSILQNSLQKTFDGESTFSLDFNMQNDGNNQNNIFNQDENSDESEDDLLNSDLIIKKNDQEQNQDYM